MNQRPTGLSLSKATVGFLQYKSAEGLSPVTVSGYDHDLKLWIEYQGDMDVAQVETTHILAYLNYLRTGYVPHRIITAYLPKSTPTRSFPWRGGKTIF